MHGWCHDGCGRRTQIARVANTAKEFTRHMPIMYVHGHNPTTKANLLLGPANSPGAWGRRGVPVERVRGWLKPLIPRYGSVERLAEAMGTTRATLSQIIWAKEKLRVSRPKAEAILRFVAAHHRPADPLAVFDTEPRRVPLPAERERAAAEARRRYLAEGVPSEHTKAWTAPVSKRELATIKRQLARQGGPRRREEEAAGEGVTISRYPDHPWRQDRYGKARYDSPSQKEAV